MHFEAIDDAFDLVACPLLCGRINIMKSMIQPANDKTIEELETEK
jgi:hypothetical protein